MNYTLSFSPALRNYQIQDSQGQVHIRAFNRKCEALEILSRLNAGLARFDPALQYRIVNPLFKSPVF